MVTERSYAGEADLPRLIDFLVAARSCEPIQRWHPGDLVWRMFYSSKFDLARCVRLWEDQRGDLVGFGWHYCPTSGADLHPRDPALLPQMIAWAKSCVAEGSLYLATIDANHSENAVLEAQSFTPNNHYGYHLRRPLNDDIPAATLPQGFTLRALAGDHEVEERALLHQEAFASQNVTVDGYRNVTHAPLYQRDFDRLVIAPDGRIAAFCLCWLDQVNRVGLIEPVGTHPDFRHMGLARAVMLDAIRRMQDCGMESLVMSVSSDNAAALALYASLGFRIECRELVYRLNTG